MIDSPILRLGARGREVRRLERLLARAGFPTGSAAGLFDRRTEAALLAFQYNAGLEPDGVARPRDWAALAPIDGGPSGPIEAEPALLEGDALLFDVEVASAMLPYAERSAIEAHLPLVLEAMSRFELASRRMILMALATIRAETDGFEPISEAVSRWNTSPRGHPFDRYDDRADLGNRGRPDGERFKGRGFVQLTGRANYARFGREIGLGDGLIRHPERANEPHVAAMLLAAFLAASRASLERALDRDDLRAARRLVNGGAHGLDRFARAYRTGDALTSEPDVASLDSARHM